MKKIFLSPGGLEVSVLALGTALYVPGSTEEEAFRQVDVYTVRAGNVR